MGASVTHQSHSNISGQPPSSSPTLEPLTSLTPRLDERAWASVPHPSGALIATCHAKAVTVFSLPTFSVHSVLLRGHDRSVRDASWRPGVPPPKLCLATGSFDATVGLWKWGDDKSGDEGAEGDGRGSGSAVNAPESLESDVAMINRSTITPEQDQDYESDSDKAPKPDLDDWEFSLVLEGHESEVKSVAFSPAGNLLATCSRDKTVWVWEDVGDSVADDEWETVGVLREHDADVKCVAFCPDVPGRSSSGRYSNDVLASGSYDNTIRIWREDGEGEWICVAVLEGHDGTVWALEWEADPQRKKFPRLMTCSADKTIRVWSLNEEDDETASASQTGNGLQRSGLGDIPNSMRQSMREEWTCTATLPIAHERDIYSISWSAKSGRVASTGSDGIIALYEEHVSSSSSSPQDGQSKTQAGQDAEMMDAELEPSTGNTNTATTLSWRVSTTVKNGHGPYEINHITWCRRYDKDASERGVEEMIVTTGDDGTINPWRIVP